MPKTPKRPRDANQLAKLMVDIAAGEADDSPALAPAGSAGGKSRAVALPKARRVEIAKKGAAARWSKQAEPSSGEPG